MAVLTAMHGASASEPAWLRRVLIGFSLAFLGVFLVLPLVLVFSEALGQGIKAYGAALTEPGTLRAAGMTLVVAGVSVALNTLFGILAALAITRFEFRGKRLLNALIDLPFTVSPVIAGLMIVLVFGVQGWFGAWLAGHGVAVLFALPGVVLATAFITFPFVARELIALMEALGREEEEAAAVLGANGWQIFWHVTLPNISGGLWYGIILCNARAMGEFGAASVVAGRVPCAADTLPLRVGFLCDGQRLQAAFAAASLLTLLAFATLLLKRHFQGRRERTSPVEALKKGLP